MRHLLRFELASYARRPGWYALLLGLLGLGVLTGWRARLSSFPLVMQNSPYQISFFAGLLSLFGIGICTLLAAQTASYLLSSCCRSGPWAPSRPRLRSITPSRILHV